ncbi:MAG: tRNA pseudouridine(38-40) synthase TruA [Rikenellaceae bacterium]|nr:tRNA pseudouridine(38-40) synthase TruA [Rikenellaceae bacterium]
MRFFLTLSYKGTAYHGWQIQENAPSVQGALQQALSILLKEPVDVVGAGRTDTGVHAAFYVAHFQCSGNKPLQEDFVYHLNAVLPKDIAVYSVRAVSNQAHARFSATLRQYKYYLLTEKDPFRIDTAYRYPLPLDLEKMNEAAAVLTEYEDFESFCKLHADNKTTLCHLQESFWIREENLLIYTVSADRFLRNMVRAIVGTLIDVGRGKTDIDQFRQIIESKNRGAAGTSAPAHGLFLTDVRYPETLFGDNK